MPRSTRWKLRQRDNRERLHLGGDVMAARTETPGGEQPVGSRLTGPQGVGAPAVTGEDVPARGGAEELTGRVSADRRPGAASEREGMKTETASESRARSRTVRKVERTIAEPKELGNDE